MDVKHDTETNVAQLCEWYGQSGLQSTSPNADHPSANHPNANQWARIFEKPADSPVTLINFFKLRDFAEYPTDTSEADLGLSGQEAFGLYAAVSIPTMERIGGKFLLVGPYEGTFIGTNEDWDLIAVGSYPNRQALLDLYSDPDYRAVFRHRTAACAKQKVIACSN